MIPPSLKVCVLVVCLASVAFADDFKTIDGKEYKNATVSRVEPDGIVLKTKSGITKVYFTELPKEVQDRFHYNAQQATQFTYESTAQIGAENRLIQQQQAEETQKKAAQLEMQRQRQQAEMQRQERLAEVQRREETAEQRRQAATQRVDKPTYSTSKEGVREHTYEVTEDHTINFGGVSIRLRRGEQYHGRILFDHAEIDRDGRSYTVPSRILRQRD